MRDLVFVTVGTDHHPFDRLVKWTESWVAGRDTTGEAGGEAPVLVQSGTSQAPRQVPYRDYIRYDEMVAAMSRAVAVVCHGGPATIMDARRYGRVPIVVPRQSGLGEHVDDHQCRFAARMADMGQVHLPTSAEELHSLLERALVDPDAFAPDEGGDEIAAAVARFAGMVDDLLASPGRRGPGNAGSPGLRGPRSTAR